MSEDFGGGQRQQGNRQVFDPHFPWAWMMATAAIAVVLVVSGWFLFVYLVSNNWG